jgi:hypothetical protein
MQKTDTVKAIENLITKRMRGKSAYLRKLKKEARVIIDEKDYPHLYQLLTYGIYYSDTAKDGMNGEKEYLKRCDKDIEVGNKYIEKMGYKVD